MLNVAMRIPGGKSHLLVPSLGERALFETLEAETALFKCHLQPFNLYLIDEADWQTLPWADNLCKATNSSFWKASKSVALQLPKVGFQYLPIV
jgi:hypothetical protein